MNAFSIIPIYKKLRRLTAPIWMTRPGFLGFTNPRVAVIPLWFLTAFSIAEYRGYADKRFC